MKKYYIISIFLFFILLPGICYAQHKYLLGSFWGFPSSGGFGYGNLGFEFDQKNNIKGWQFSINMSAGAIASDAGNTNRKWITADRLHTIKSSFNDKNQFFYTLFIETGNRKVTNGWWKPYKDTVLNNRNAFELNPGMGLGTNIKLFKKIRLQLIAAPKAVFAFHKDKYRDITNSTFFIKKYADLTIGYRIAANFCFRL